MTTTTNTPRWKGARPRDPGTAAMRATLTAQEKRDAAIMRAYWDNDMLEITAVHAGTPASITAAKLACMEITRRFLQT